jgi:hypothetical protein
VTGRLLLFSCAIAYVGLSIVLMFLTVVLRRSVGMRTREPEVSPRPHQPIGRPLPQIDKPIHGRDHDRTADDIAESDWEEIAGEKACPRELGHLLRRLAPRSMTCASSRTNKPMGMKYIFAIECSHPDATNAVIGGMIATILSVVVRALKHNQTARHTRALQKTPRANPVENRGSLWRRRY